ncbi:MAG: hypothetical protein M3N19_03160 [Candidatus Eremiobacteraeota bacterium]|nr:hypothetical protein [Candidatus Eremiobacteraeota bacterium]
MSIGIPHVGHTAAWEYLEHDRILRIKQFRQDDEGEVIANYLHLQVADEHEARQMAEPIVAILNDRDKVSGMTQTRDGGVMYVYRPENLQSKQE